MRESLILGVRKTFAEEDLCINLWDRRDKKEGGGEGPTPFLLFILKAALIL